MNIIFLPVNYDQHLEGDHWRISRPENNYQIVVCQFNDNVISEAGYDYKFEQKGFKWGLNKYFLNNVIELIADPNDIEYVGFLDDDLKMSYQEMNNLLAFAKDNSIDIFQPALTQESNCHYSITRHDDRLLYTKTNFIEGMCAFFAYKDIEVLKDLLNYYDVQHGWGIDFVWHQLFNKPLHVIHAHPITHPNAPSSYDLNDGGVELRNFLKEIAPKYFREKNQIWSIQPFTIFWEKCKWKNVFDFM
jgi:hypothetical protein